MNRYWTSWEWCQKGAVTITHLGGCVAGDYCLPVPNDEAALVLVHAEHLRFESFVEIRTNIYTHLLHQQSSHGCSQTCNRYEICGRLHSSSEELKRQAEFLSVILQVWRLFLTPKRSRRFFTFLHQNYFFFRTNLVFFLHQNNFFLHQMISVIVSDSAPNLFWLCTKVTPNIWKRLLGMAARGCPT